MNKEALKHWRFVMTMRWLARITSILSMGTILGMFARGEEIKNLASNSFGQWVMIFLVPGALIFGMLLGWWKEMPGGVIAVGSALMYTVVKFMVEGTWNGEFEYIFFAIPGMLFVATWALDIEELYD